MGERPHRVAVISSDGDATAETQRLLGALRDDGEVVVVANAANIPADAAGIVAVGSAAIRETIASAPGAPVIPVGDHRLAFDATTATRRAAALVRAAVTEPAHAHYPCSPSRSAAVDGSESATETPRDDPFDTGIRRVTHPILGVDRDQTDDTGCRAGGDVALVTTEPARISEFALRLDRGRVASFRADGVVIATPFGSDGYASAAGGPTVAPGGGLAVVPIAPFSTRTAVWIAADRVTLSVERETEPVSIVIDGEERGPVSPHRPLTIEVVDRVSLVVPIRGSARDDRKHSNNS